MPLTGERMTKKKKKDKKKGETDGEFKKVRELLSQSQDNFHKNYLARQLHEKDNLRAVFLSLVKNSPARISELYEDALLTKPTCYSQLHKLISYDMAERVFVMDVKKGDIDTKAAKDNEKEIEKKFDKWVGTMPEKLQRYYLAKTSYWIITDLGKELAMKAYKFEQEFREDRK